MNIAIVNHGIFPDVIGGMERHTYNLARQLQTAGVHVDVLIPEPSTNTNFPFPVHYLPWPKRPAWLWSNHAYSHHVSNWLNNHSVDLAFGQGFNLWAYLRHRKIPSVFHPHGLEMFGSHLRGTEHVTALPFRALVRYHGKHSDSVISLGGKLTSILVNRAGIPPAKIMEIANAVDCGEFQLGTKTRKSTRILFVGRLAFNKGIDLLIDALALLKNADFDLTIIGDGRFRGNIEQLARRDPRVTFIPHANEQDLQRHYQSHSALLFTSRFEGAPTVILEAMASGAAIIATNIGAVETLIDERNGILIEPTAISIATGIRTFLQLSETQIQVMGALSRKKATDFFDWKVVIPRYLNLFENLIRGRS